METKGQAQVPPYKVYDPPPAYTVYVNSYPPPGPSDTATLPSTARLSGTPPVRYAADGTVYIENSETAQDKNTGSSSRDILGMILAIFTCLFCFWPLGVIAIILSGVALSYRSQGNENAARRATTISIIISLVTVLVGVLLIVAVYLSAKHYTESQHADLSTTVASTILLGSTP